MKAPIIAAALALIATAAGAADKDAWKAAVPDGPAVDCLPIVQIRNTRVRDDRTIDFYTNGNKVYRNTLPQSCPSLGFEQRFSYQTSISQLCSVDIITVLFQAGGPGLQSGAGCGLGKFQPVSGVK